jgi:hypothetical protein
MFLFYYQNAGHILYVDSGTKLYNILPLLNIINMTELRWMNCLEHVHASWGMNWLGNVVTSGVHHGIVGMIFYFRNLKVVRSRHVRLIWNGPYRSKVWMSGLGSAGLGQSTVVVVNLQLPYKWQIFVTSGVNIN